MKTLTLFDNYNTEEYEADAREYLENSLDGYSESEVYDLVNNYIEEDYRWLETVMDNTFGKDRLIVSGSVGRWNGKITGAEIYDTWSEFISKFGKDCEYFKIYIQSRHLYVECSHHDGNNFCEVKRITDRGENYYENWQFDIDPRTRNRSEAYILTRMFHDSAYAQLPEIKFVY